MDRLFHDDGKLAPLFFHLTLIHVSMLKLFISGETPIVKCSSEYTFRQKIIVVK